MQVLSVASEIFPLVKTGGLADVVGALPAALARKGVAMRTLVPGYPAVLEKLERRDDGASLRRSLRRTGRASRRRGGRPRSPRHRRAASLRAAGNPYVDRSGRDWPDNAQRFAALAHVAADIGTGLLKRYRPHVVHAHDWQAGLVPAYLHYGRRRRGRRP